MLKLFLFHIIFSIIQFASVEASSFWFEVSVNTKSIYGNLSCELQHEKNKVYRKSFTLDSSGNNLNDFLGSNLKNYPVINIFVNLNFNSLKIDFQNRFLFFGTGVSPPNGLFV